MSWLLDPQAWIGLVTLAVLEIVLGVDNIVFISILSDKLPAARRSRARKVGLAVAMVTRILLLLSLSFIMRLTTPLVTAFSLQITGRDLVLIAGGLFLLFKATHEIHQKLEGDEGQGAARAAASFSAVIAQIALLDVVFSLDSVITAVGMVSQIGVMVTAIVLAVAVMMWAADPISDFINLHPTVKVLALSFLLLIGVTLIAEGFGQHIPKGYVYFAMAFSVFVELLNIRAGKGAPVKLREPYARDAGSGQAERGA